MGSVWHSLLGHQAAFDFAAKTLSVDPSQPVPGAQQPMKLVLQNNYMEVPVAFGGGAPVQTLYDTGAGLTVMDQSYVDITPYNWFVDLKNDTFSIAPNGSASIASAPLKSVPGVLKVKLPSVLQGVRRLKPRRPVLLRRALACVRRGAL